MTKKSWIVLLLLFSCFTAGLLFWHVEPVHTVRLTSPAQLDSLILMTFDEFQISGDRIRTRPVEIDSVFSRIVYSAAVPPSFSKTSFHYRLQLELMPYNVTTAGEVEFPDRDLRIHLLYNHNVYRSVFLFTEETPE